jgi:hypothetical protein
MTVQHFQLRIDSMARPPGWLLLHSPHIAALPVKPSRYALRNCQERLMKRRITSHQLDRHRGTAAQHIWHQRKRSIFCNLSITAFAPTDSLLAVVCERRNPYHFNKGNHKSTHWVPKTPGTRSEVRLSNFDPFLM